MVCSQWHRTPMMHCLAVQCLTHSHGQLVQTVLWCHGMWMRRQSVAQQYLQLLHQTSDRSHLTTLLTALKGKLVRRPKHVHGTQVSIYRYALFWKFLRKFENF